MLYDFNKFLSTVCLISGNNHCHVPMFLTSKKPHGLIDELALSTSMTSVVKYQLIENQVERKFLNFVKWRNAEVTKIGPIFDPDAHQSGPKIRFVGFGTLVQNLL